VPNSIGQHDHSIKTIPLAAMKVGATYTLRTRIRTNGGTDSYGDVLLVTGASAFGARPAWMNQ